jgi:hypothetical protein
LLCLFVSPIQNPKETVGSLPIGCYKIRTAHHEREHNPTIHISSTMITTRNKVFFLRAILKQLPMLANFPFHPRPDPKLIAMAWQLKQYMDSGKDIKSWPEKAGERPQIGMAKARDQLASSLTFIHSLKVEIERLRLIAAPMPPQRTRRGTTPCTTPKTPPRTPPRTAPCQLRRTVPTLEPKVHRMPQRTWARALPVPKAKPERQSDALYGQCGEGTLPAALASRNGSFGFATSLVRGMMTPMVTTANTRLDQMLDQSSESDSDDTHMRYSSSDSSPTYTYSSSSDDDLSSQGSSSSYRDANAILDDFDVTVEDRCDSLLSCLPSLEIGNVPVSMQLRCRMEDLELPSGLWADLVKCYWEHADLLS